MSTKGGAAWEKLIFAAVWLVVGLGVLGGLRRRSDLLPPALRSVVRPLMLALAVVPSALILVFSVFRIIPAGQVGVKVLFGETRVLQPVHVEMILNYRLVPERAPEVYRSIGLGYERVIIDPAAQLKGDAEAAYNAKVASSLTPSPTEGRR